MEFKEGDLVTFGKSYQRVGVYGPFADDIIKIIAKKIDTYAYYGISIVDNYQYERLYSSEIQLATEEEIAKGIAKKMTIETSDKF